MFRSSRSCFVCGLLILVLAAAPLAAAGPAGRPESRATGLAVLWSWLAELWSENGCYIDPNGGCGGARSAPSVPAENEGGCYIDPHGGCGGARSAPSVPAENENGCFIDPNGGCGG